MTHAGRSYGLAAIVAAAAVMTGCGSSPDSAADKAAEKVQNMKYGAQDVCETFVERRLKSPATADFGDLEVVQSGPAYVVTGTVDSENSFGASLRNEFVCRVKAQDAAGENWQLVRMRGLSN